MRFVKAVTLGACLCIAAPALNAQEADRSPRIAMLSVMQSGDEVFANAPPSTASSAQESADQIGAVVILGNEAIDDARYQAVVEDFFGEPRSEEVLARLTKEIADLAREEGYQYVRADVLDDANGFGVVQVSVDEGRIDSLEIQGYDNDQARRILSRLIGRPAKKSELEAALLLVTDIPAVALKDAKISRRDGEGVLVVTLEKKGARYRIEADNYGTRSFGPVRAIASTRQTDVLASSDQLYVAVRANPVELDELLFVSASYQSQIATNGLTAGVSGSIGTTSPGGPFGDGDVSGDSLRAGLFLSQPIIRSKDFSLWANANGAYITIEQDDLGQILRDDTVVTASLGLATQWAVAGGRLRAGITHERGLGILGATRRGSAFASRSDGDGVYSKVQFWSDLRVPIAKRFDIFLAGGGQIADRPLLASEEMALGGPYRTRGYDFSEVLGDEGIYGLAELRYRFATETLPFDFLQLYAFVDGGYVSDLGAGFGEGSLFSAGPGVRGRIGPVGFEVEGGFPLGGSAERGDNNSPELNVRAGINF